MVAFCAGRKNSYGRDPLCQVEVLPLSPKYGSIESSRGSKKKTFRPPSAVKNQIFVFCACALSPTGEGNFEVGGSRWVGIRGHTWA